MESSRDLETLKNAIKKSTSQLRLISWDPGIVNLACSSLTFNPTAETEFELLTVKSHIHSLGNKNTPIPELLVNLRIFMDSIQSDFDICLIEEQPAKVRDQFGKASQSMYAVTFALAYEWTRRGTPVVFVNPRLKNSIPDMPKLDFSTSKQKYTARKAHSKICYAILANQFNVHYISHGADVPDSCLQGIAWYLKTMG